MRHAATAFIALVLCYPSPSRSQDRTTALLSCDQAAASPLDKNRPAGVAGVTPDKIDPKIAIPACEAAAKASPNDPRIMFQLGRAYDAAKAYESARTQYAKAADQGNALAQNNLGTMYLSGHGVPQDYAAAVRWYRKAADQGFAGAQLNLGVIYANGQGTAQDYADAVNWLRKAADQGIAIAQYSLGVMYANGRGVPQDYAAAVNWYRKAADQGIATAQSNLGVMFANGQGVPQDYAAAVRWYQKAADQGYATAQSNLGVMYASGQGVPQDHAAAMRWYRKAADQGYATAQYNLGVMFANGRGVPRDYAAAVRWYQKAADQGYAGGQNNLGFMYDNGHGVPQDYVSAHMWFNLAAAGGHKDAPKNRDFVAAKMTPTQLAEAQKHAREWRPKMAMVASTQAEPPRPASRKPDPEVFSGTAFFVSKDGKALTNAHVVEGCRQISVNTDGQSTAAKVLAKDERNDLALLMTDLHPAQLINWRVSVLQGEEVVVYGFPLSGMLASGGNITTGNVTALAGLGNDSRFLQISAPVQPGNSGGPLLDRNGTVIGIVVAKLNALFGHRRHSAECQFRHQGVGGHGISRRSARVAC